MMNVWLKLVFEVTQEADGGFCAECLTENIFTEGDTWDQLRKNVIEATNAFFFDKVRPEESAFILCVMKCSPSREDTSRCVGLGSR